MSKARMLGHPPAPKSVDDFIDAAEVPVKPESTLADSNIAKEPAHKTTEGQKKTAKKPKADPMPWESPAVREDVTKLFSLRLPEPYMLKLKWLSEQGGGSMHKFCLSVLLPEIDKQVVVTKKKTP